MSPMFFAAKPLKMNPAISECILILAVCFNAILSVVNGHVVQLQRTHVVVAEIAIYAAALAIIFFNADRKNCPASDRG